MSNTAVIEEMQYKSFQLQNGQSFNVLSNESEALDAIPVIDIADIYSEEVEERQRVADQIRQASHGIGFFYITNHVITQSLSLVAVKVLTSETGNRS